MFIAIIACVAAITSISTSYGVNTTSDVQNIVDLANQSSGTLAGWTQNTSYNVTQNNWAGQIYMLTSGTFSILANMITTLPGIFSNIFVAFIKAIAIPLGFCNPATGVCDSFTSLIIALMETWVLAIFAFAVIWAILKVKL